MTRSAIRSHRTARVCRHSFVVVFSPVRVVSSRVGVVQHPCGSQTIAVLMGWCVKSICFTCGLCIMELARLVIQQNDIFNGWLGLSTFGRASRSTHKYTHTNVNTNLVEYPRCDICVLGALPSSFVVSVSWYVFCTQTEVCIQNTG